MLKLAPRVLLPVLALAACLLTFWPEAQARPQGLSSAWSPSSRSAVRLVVGEVREGRAAAGLEIRLAAGYKTYWRSPGDSGLPPRLDWSASENLASASLSWPVPTRFSDGAGHSIGYVSDVLLPLDLVAQDPARPMRLVLKLDYAVCEKICIPAQGLVTLALPVGGADPQAQARIEAASRLVPRPPAPGYDAVALWQPAAGADKPDSLEITLQGLAEEPQDVFIDGPEMWAFGLAVQHPGVNGARRITVPVEDRPKSAAGRQRFVLTLACAGGPLEIAVDLDIPAPRP